MNENRNKKFNYLSYVKFKSFNLSHLKIEELLSEYERSDVQA